MADTSTFALKLTGTGLSIDQKIPKELATQIMLLVFGDGGVERQGRRESQLDADKGDAGVSKRPGTGKSLREFVNDQGAKKIPQQIVAIGSHRQQATGKDHFTRDELVAGFKDAKLPPPGNLPRDIGRAVGLGWISPNGSEKDQYYVTGTGEEELESKFTKTKKTTGGARRRRRGKKVPKKTA